MKAQGGGFALGLVAGLLIGLALALGVALYITKVPVPFVDKVPQRTVEQDNAEAERNKTWDPNAPLAAKPVPQSAADGSPPAVGGPVTSARDPAAILSGAAVQPAPAVATASTNPGADPFAYFVQTGAYRRADDAEAQRAALAIQGLTARVTEREQSGRTVHRVRLGPFEQKAEAEAMHERLRGAGIEGQLVRVQR